MFTCFIDGVRTLRAHAGAAMLLAALNGCVAPAPVMQASPHHLVILTTPKPDERVTSAKLVYGNSRPIEMSILGMGGAGEFHVNPVPERVQLSWTDREGNRQERDLKLRPELPADMDGRTLQFEIENNRLKVFVDTPVGRHDMERRAIYSD